MSAVDLHQHLWPEAWVDALRRRDRAPYLRGWTLYTEGEPPYDVRPDDHDVRARILADQRDGIELACVSLSAPIGVDEPDLVDAWHRAALELPPHFAAWASVPAAEELASMLAGPFVGLQLPTTRLLTPEAWESAGDLLRVAELAGKPVLVHPGPTVAADAPGWWAPVVGYVGQLHAAWWAWHAYAGRRAFPDLRLVFAAGAGLAPLHHERLAARGGRISAIDPQVFVDTSSYGSQALDALVRVLGIDALVLGSDRPYAEPVAALFGDAATHAVRVVNPRRALGLPEVAAVVA
jgi:predicted TIM-barrel fold metal-dependent hydrolase